MNEFSTEYFAEEGTLTPMDEKRDNAISIALMSVFYEEFRGVTPHEMLSDEQAKARFCSRFRENWGIELADTVIEKAFRQILTERILTREETERTVQQTAKAMFEATFKLAMGAECSVRFYKNGSIAFVVAPEAAKVWNNFAPHSTNTR